MSRHLSSLSELAGLRNLGPKSVALLNEVGITTRKELAAVGAVEACRRMKNAGHSISRNMAYAIEGALMDCDWRELPIEFRKQIATAFKSFRDEKSVEKALYLRFSAGIHDE